MNHVMSENLSEDLQSKVRNKRTPFLKHTKYRSVLFMILGILAGLFLAWLAYVLFFKNLNRADGLSGDGVNSDQSEIKMIAVPFRAEFTLHYVATYEDINQCGEIPWMRVIVDGAGTEQNLGEITAYLEFCAQTATGVYLDAKGWFITAQGDSLFIDTWGQIIPADENDPPYYVNKWNDPFKFVRGTGRFEGATGGGMTNCFNSTKDDVSHHTWEGTLTMKEE